MVKIVALAALVASAVVAVISSDLLVSALFLGLSSVAASITYYLFGAVQAGLVELSVGAGLTTILFIVSITMSGAAKVKTPARPAATRAVGFWLALTVLFALTYSMTSSGATSIVGDVPRAFSDVSPVLWGTRIADLWGIVFLIVATGIGVATLFRPGGASR